MTIPKDTLEAFGDDELRARVFWEKYSMRNDMGAPTETKPEQMWERVSREIASAETTPVLQKEWKNKFYWLLSDFKFVPGGRILFGAGQSRNSTLINCYVIAPPEDSIESIFDTAKSMARTYSYGGGCGTDISKLRPKNAPVNNSAIVSTGSASFMQLYSTTTGTIGQAGRRGALMITLDVNHPDIEDFITIKRDLSKVNHANISIKITDEFMKAVEDDTDFVLRFENAKVKMQRTVKARGLWNNIVKSAWMSAEPGLIFWDTMKRGSTTEYNGMEIVTTNPCSEQGLESWGCCNLGSINLSYFVKNPFTKEAVIDYAVLDEACITATRFLDDVLDYNADKHPLPQQREASLRSRRVGAGVTGLGDMFIKLGIKYDSEEALSLVAELFEFIRNTVYRTSCGLAEEKGSFPAFDAEKHLVQPFIQQLPQDIKDKIAKTGIRNAALLTVPPVGSGSILVNSSSGIEPIFALSYKRRSHSLSQGEFEVVNPLIGESLRANNVGDIKLTPAFVTRFVNENPEFVVSHDIKPEFRVRMQGTIQKYIDNAISSTINLPQDVSVDTVGLIYFQAWKEGIKGVTVYREGSRQGILETDAVDKKKPETVAPAVPNDFVRPQILTGKTIKMPIPTGSLYIAANQDESGKVIEVFVELGKRSGEEKANAEAMGRLISLYLQKGGGDVKDVIRILKGIRGRNITWHEGQQILSMPDAVAKALDIMVNGKKERKAQYTAAPMTNVETLEICPECSEAGSIKHEGGCILCEACGFSKCE